MVNGKEHPSLLPSDSLPTGIQGRGDLQLPRSVDSQTQCTAHRVHFSYGGARLCCYRTEAVVDDGCRGTELLALVPRQTRTIYAKELREFGLGALSSCLSDQFTLSCRDRLNTHRCAIDTPYVQQ